MRPFIILSFFITCFAFLCADEDCDHRTGKSRNNFFPATRFIITPVSVNNDTGFSFLGETGMRHCRFNGTWGGFWDECFRFKAGGEYLAQKLQYNFSSGHEREWVHQLALGANLQAFHCHWYCIRGAQVTGFYSHSLGKSLHTKECESFEHLLKRRVAGSWSYFIEGGIMTTPSGCSSLLFSGGFGQVNYKRHFKKNKGLLGPTFSFDYNHYFNERLGLNLRGQYTRAYNYLDVLLSWCLPLHYGQLSVGAFGVHTWGKHHLPSSTIAGVEIRFNFGFNRCGIMTRDRCFNGDIDSCDCDLTGLGGWLANPAVYAPQVFAIKEQRHWGHK